MRHAPVGGGRVGLTHPAASTARHVREEQKPSRTPGRLAARTHSGVNETVLEAAGLRRALSGTADMMPFQPTLGCAENTGYHANQTWVNSLRYELRKTSGQISSALKHLGNSQCQTLFVWLVVTTWRGRRPVQTTAHRRGDVAEAGVRGECCHSGAGPHMLRVAGEDRPLSDTRSTCHASHGPVTQLSSPWPPQEPCSRVTRTCSYFSRLHTRDWLTCRTRSCCPGLDRSRTRATQVRRPGGVSGADPPARTHTPRPARSLTLWPGPSATRVTLVPKHTPTWKASVSSVNETVSDLSSEQQIHFSQLVPHRSN